MPPDWSCKRDAVACGVPAARARDVQRRHEALRGVLRKVVLYILRRYLWFALVFRCSPRLVPPLLLQLLPSPQPLPVAPIATFAVTTSFKGGRWSMLHPSPTIWFLVAHGRLLGFFV